MSRARENVATEIDETDGTDGTDGTDASSVVRGLRGAASTVRVSEVQCAVLQCGLLQGAFSGVRQGVCGGARVRGAAVGGGRSGHAKYDEGYPGEDA